MPGIGLIARPGRKVGRNHLAVLRGAVRYLAPLELAERSLGATEDRIDAAAVARILQWLRLEFAGAAAHAGQPALYRDIPFLSLRTMAAVGDRARRRLKALPDGALSLEELEARAPEGF